VGKTAGHRGTGGPLIRAPSAGAAKTGRASFVPRSAGMPLPILRWKGVAASGASRVMWSALTKRPWSSSGLNQGRRCRAQKAQFLSRRCGVRAVASFIASLHRSRWYSTGEFVLGNLRRQW